MAERRMFAKTVIDSDCFMEMPASAQALYFHLAMRADDEGFLNAPRGVMKRLGSSEDDMRVLIAKRFILPFESGIIVIRHWKLHNWIRGDRLQETACKAEKALVIEDGNVYEPGVRQVSDKCQTSVSIGKVRLGEVSTHVDPEANETKKPKKKNRDFPAHIVKRFDALWAVYPRKDGRLPALRAYAKVADQPGIDEAIKAGIERYNKYLASAGTEYGYIKMGSTWFNQHSWEDEYRIGTDIKTKREKRYESII